MHMFHISQKNGMKRKPENAGKRRDVFDEVCGSKAEHHFEMHPAK